MTGTWKSLLPDFPFGAGTAAASWGLCDVVHSIILNNFNQVGGGTCGPTALLDALSFRSNKNAFKTATMLLWTGTLPTLPVPPCPYIFGQFPGLVQFPDPDKVDCSNPVVWPNGADCQKMKNFNQPLNAVGLQAAWVQSMLAAQAHSVAGACSTDGPLQLMTEYNIETEWASIKAAQQTVPAQMEWIGTHVLGVDMTYHVGTSELCKGLTFTSGALALPDPCSRVLSFPGVVGTDVEVLKNLIPAVLTGDRDWSWAVNELENGTNERLKRMLTTCANMTSHDQLPSVVKAMADSCAILPGAVPFTTSNVLEEACNNHKFVILNIAADVLGSFSNSAVQGVDTGEFTIGELCQQYNIAGCESVTADGSFSTGCNHWVLLESCPSDNQSKYHLWSWGASGYKMSEKVLQTSICGVLHEK